MVLSKYVLTEEEAENLKVLEHKKSMHSVLASIAGLSFVDMTEVDTAISVVLGPKMSAINKKLARINALCSSNKNNSMRGQISGATKELWTLMFDAEMADGEININEN